MKIVIIGGGSVGLLMAARLALAHEHVQLVTRSEEQAASLRNQPVVLHTLQGEKKEVPIFAQAHSAALPIADLYLLTVKQPDIRSLLPALRGIPSTARVLALQNGLGHQEVLGEVCHPSQIFFAVNTEGARRLSPREVVHTGRGLLRIGPPYARQKRDRIIEAFVQLASQAGMEALYVEETSSYLWRKVLANAVINPLTGIFEITNGELLDSPITLKTMRMLFDEAKRVAETQGEKITEADWQDILTICRNTSRNYSSMLQDLKNNRQTEIDAINGYIARIGRQMEVSVPMNDTVRRVIQLKSSLQLQRGEAKDGVIQ